MMNRYEAPTILMVDADTKDILTLSDLGLYDDQSNIISWNKLREGIDA